MNKNCLFTLVLSACFLLGCASLQQPQGGAKDIEPPKVLNESPKNLTRNFKGQKVSITFDEYFKLSSEFTEISISPETEVLPTFKIKQKTLEITFKDSLEKNTTYSINFGKAIQDVNESNILKNYAFVFSTGPELDSLSISGKVISSQDNKTAKDATVFIFPAERDTLLGKKKPSIFTTTDSAGNFSLKNLRAADYKIYALKENGGDRIYNGNNEEIGFLGAPIKLNKDTNGIILKLFKEVPEKLRVLEKKIDDNGKILYTFNKPIKNPTIKFLSPLNVTNPVIEYGQQGDSISMWLRSYDFDSLKVNVQEGQKLLDSIVIRKARKQTYERNILFSNNLSAGKITPANPLILTFNLPIDSLYQAQVLLSEDSVAKKNFTIKRNIGTRSFLVEYPWKVKKRYTISFPENSVTDIYGTKNKALKLDFELDEVENFGNLALNVALTDSSKAYIVQLFLPENKLFKSQRVDKDQIINFSNIATNKYTVRVIEDINRNGVFDTGNIKEQRQPEKVWFYEKEIVTRANWDREEKIVIPKEFDN